MSCRDFARNNRMYVKANGINFYCEIDGPETAPWLVLSNSLATNLHMFDSQAADFRNSYRVLRYDQRGHGKTDVTSGGYTFELLIDDIIAIMNELGIERCDWCGVSMGGSTAMGAVQMHPERFRRVVICDTTGRSTPVTKQQWGERIALARQSGMQALADITLPRWFPPETIQGKLRHIDLIREMILTTPVDGFCGGSAALAEYDYRTMMPTVKHPVLYICGEKDGPNAGVMREMQRELPSSEYFEIPGGGHISNMDQPAMFTRAVREFLAN